jgi:hypothetical protein
MQNHLEPDNLASIRERRERARGSANIALGRIIPMQVQEKPTFQHIRLQAKTTEGQPITRQDLATLTGLSIGEVYVIDIGGYSSGKNIRAVLRIFNALTGQKLAMDDIYHQGAVL